MGGQENVAAGSCEHVGVESSATRSSESFVANNSGAAVCQFCGWVLDHIPIEQEWELLERCPRCGGYAWNPPPQKVRARVEPDGG